MSFFNKIQESIAKRKAKQSMERDRLARLTAKGLAEIRKERIKAEGQKRIYELEKIEKDKLRQAKSRDYSKISKVGGKLGTGLKTGLKSYGKYLKQVRKERGSPFGGSSGIDTTVNRGAFDLGGSGINTGVNKSAFNLGGSDSGAFSLGGIKSTPKKKDTGNTTIIIRR